MSRQYCAGNVCWGTSASPACLATTVVRQSGQGTGLASLDYTTVGVTFGAQLLAFATYVPTPGNGYAPNSNGTAAAPPPPAVVRGPGPLLCWGGPGHSSNARSCPAACSGCCVARNSPTTPSADCACQGPLSSFFDSITGSTITLPLLGAQAAACVCPSQHARKYPGVLHWPAVPPHCHKSKAVPWPTCRSAAHQCQSCPAHHLVPSRPCRHPRWPSRPRQGPLPLRRRSLPSRARHRLDGSSRLHQPRPPRRRLGWLPRRPQELCKVCRPPPGRAG